MRNLSVAFGENSWAQLTMNSSASSSRSFSTNGDGSIELKSWLMSRSFRLMVCGCPGSVVAMYGNEKCIPKSLPSSAYQYWPTNIDSVHQGVLPCSLRGDIFKQVDRQGRRGLVCRYPPSSRSMLVQ